MVVTATHVNYFCVCHRKLWLFSHGIQMEQTSERVAEGKLVGETSYGNRPEKYTELEIDGVKIDYLDTKEKVVREVKLTDKVENAHIWQVKYYLYILKQNRMDGYSGLIEYPKMRQTEPVELMPEDTPQIEEMLKTIENILVQACPATIDKPLCKQCSYYDLCYVEE